MNRIKQLREEFNITQIQLAKKMNKTQQTISLYEKGTNEPDLDGYILLSKLFNCSVEYVAGKSDVRNPENILQYDREKILKGLKDAVKSDWEIKPSPLIIDDVQQHFLENLNSESNKIRNIFSIPTTVVDIPIVGKISAGQPILTQETIEGYLPVDPSIYGVSTAEDLFFLRVSGQSMNLKVKNGDYALIKKQDYAEDGDIVVAIVNGDSEATLKRYKKLNEQFVLLEPMSSDPSIEAITVDLKTTDFHIIGKAIGQFGKF